MTEFSTMLRRFRKAGGLTQGDLGRALGVPQSTVSKWEKGLQRPSGESVERLERLTGIPKAVVLGEARGAEPRTGEAGGFAEMKQAAFKTPAAPATATGKPNESSSGGLQRHPAWGLLKGTTIIPPDVDITAPTAPEWGRLNEQ